MNSAQRVLRRTITSCPHVKLRSRDNRSSVSNEVTHAKIIPRSFREIPEPKSLPLLGTALEYSPLKKFDPSYLGEHWVKRHEQLGPIYKENIIPGVTEYIVYSSSPQDTEHMLRQEGECPIRDPLGPLLKVREQMGEHRGLTNANGKEWKRIRKIINQHFLKNSVVWKVADDHYKVALDFVEYIKNNLDSNNEVPDFDKVLNRWAFESTGVFALDTRLGALEQNISPKLQEMIHHNEIMFKSMGKLLYGLPYWKYWNTKELQRLYEGHKGQIQAARYHMVRILDECRTMNKDSKFTNLESILHSSKLLKEEKLMLMTEFLVAGIDTTSNAVAFLLYALATNPEKQEILRKEIYELAESGRITGKDLSNAKYLQACIKETQRMYPFVSSSSRRYPEDIVLSGHVVPAGTHVLNTSNMVNSRNPKYFDEPDTFLPERWLRNRSVKERQGQRFVMSGPFGLGVRMCPGRKFSMQELQMAVTAILQNFHIEYHHKSIKVAFRLVSFPSEKPQFKFIPLEESEKWALKTDAQSYYVGNNGNIQSDSEVPQDETDTEVPQKRSYALK